MSEKITARRLAFHSLLKCYNDKKYSNIEIDSVIKKNNMDPREKALFTAIVYGVIEKRIMLDFIISVLAQRPVGKIEPAVMTSLEMGIYQILFFDRVPDSAACNESVEITKRISGLGAASFVNAVLRKTVRIKDSAEDIYKHLEGNEYKSIKYSVPVWMIEVFEKSYGAEKAEEILRNFEAKSYMTLRTNTLRTDRDALIKLLCDGGINAEPCGEVKNGIRLLRSASAEHLNSVCDGLYIVQDTASQLAVEKLDIQKGDFIIDCCACPGGKSISAAFCAENVGTVISMDLHKNKLSLIEKSASAMGIDIIKTMAHDGTSPLEDYIGKADKVICDVPCSGFGVIHKKPDIRHKLPVDIQRLPEVQYKILTASSRYLRPGGKLLYSTCTLNKCENDDITAKFLSENPNFRRASGEAEGCTLFPTVKDGIILNDGFFTDILERVE